MLQKLIFLLVTAILFTGCGASAPAADSAENAQATSTAECRMETAAVAPAEERKETPEESAEVTVPAAEYFLFDRYSGSVENEDGQILLYENYCQASFSSDDEDRVKWVDGILKGISRDYAVDSENLYAYAEEFVELNGTEHFYSHSNYQDLGIARCDSSVVSLIALSSLYAGGTHPNSVQVAYNLDIDGQRILKLEDVLLEEGTEALGNLVLESVNAKFSSLGEGALFDDYADTIVTSMTWGNMTPYWYFNTQGLVIFYNQYELGPYAAGIIKVELPYADLTDILRPEYLPEVTENVPGALVQRGEWEGYRRIPITIDPEGDTILIGVEGRIYQVRLSEVLWLENTPVAQQLLFASVAMGQNDVLEITGGYTDESRSFAIEFTTGQGEEKIVYIHAEGLSDEP